MKAAAAIVAMLFASVAFAADVIPKKNSQVSGTAGPPPPGYGKPISDAQKKQNAEDEREREMNKGNKKTAPSKTHHGNQRGGSGSESSAPPVSNKPRSDAQKKKDAEFTSGAIKKRQFNGPRSN